LRGVMGAGGSGTGLPASSQHRQGSPCGPLATRARTLQAHVHGYSCAQAAGISADAQRLGSLQPSHPGPPACVPACQAASVEECRRRCPGLQIRPMRTDRYRQAGACESPASPAAAEQPPARPLPARRLRAAAICALRCDRTACQRLWLKATRLTARPSRRVQPPLPARLASAGGAAGALPAARLCPRWPGREDKLRWEPLLLRRAHAARRCASWEQAAASA
jgi:hypothetical protein